MLSEDDINLRELNEEELDAAWDFWFDLAQATNDSIHRSDGPRIRGSRFGFAEAPGDAARAGQGFAAASYTIRPPTSVITGVMSLIWSAGIVR